MIYGPDLERRMADMERRRVMKERMALLRRQLLRGVMIGFGVVLAGAAVAAAIISLVVFVPVWVWFLVGAAIWLGFVAWTFPSASE